MKKKIFEFIKNLVDSLHNERSGFSGRKLTALAIIIMFGSSHESWLESARATGNYSLFQEILIIDFCMIAICLGLITMESIIKLKNGNKDEKPAANSPA
jgi:hypothetical protein